MSSGDCGLGSLATDSRLTDALACGMAGVVEATGVAQVSVRAGQACDGPVEGSTLAVGDRPGYSRGSSVWQVEQAPGENVFVRYLCVRYGDGMGGGRLRSCHEDACGRGGGESGAGVCTGGGGLHAGRLPQGAETQPQWGAVGLSGGQHTWTLHHWTLRQPPEAPCDWRQGCVCGGGEMGGCEGVGGAWKKGLGHHPGGSVFLACKGMWIMWIISETRARGLKQAPP